MKRDQEAGFSLLEVVIVMGIMGAMALAFMSMQSSQIKANNFLLYQVRRTEIKGAILGQFLNDPANCGCLFRNAGA
ncbi:MAG: type II secretion system protein, partial [Proteobacteria bacterium]